MKSQRLLYALGQVDDWYIEDAAPSPRLKHRRKWVRWCAAAACLCLAVAAIEASSWQRGNIQNAQAELGLPPSTGPALFKITVYASSESEEVALLEERELEEGTVLPWEYGWLPGLNSLPGLPIKLSSSDYQDVSFEVSADGGQFVLLDEDGGSTPLSSPFVAENNTLLYWQAAEEGPVPSCVYVDIIVRDGDAVVGYAVLQLSTAPSEQESDPFYYVVLRKAVSFPRLDGAYQDVTEAYVRAAIEEAKTD